jgi:predicted Zn-dependent protease
MVHFIKRDFSKAFPYLEKGFFKNWVTMGMLAVTYMKRNKRDLMRQTFEKAVLASPKESLLWSLYGYCLNECGETVKGCEVLAKGLSKLPGDENLKQNLDLLREGKKLKMKGYGEAWLQFHLESLGTIQKQQMAAMGGRRRTVRK